MKPSWDEVKALRDDQIAEGRKKSEKERKRGRVNVRSPYALRSVWHQTQDDLRRFRREEKGDIRGAGRTSVHDQRRDVQAGERTSRSALARRKTSRTDKPQK